MADSGSNTSVSTTQQAAAPALLAPSQQMIQAQPAVGGVAQGVQPGSAAIAPLGSASAGSASTVSSVGSASNLIPVLAPATFSAAPPFSFGYQVPQFGFQSPAAPPAHTIAEGIQILSRGIDPTRAPTGDAREWLKSGLDFINFTNPVNKQYLLALIETTPGSTSEILEQLRRSNAVSSTATSARLTYASIMDEFATPRSGTDMSLLALQSCNAAQKYAAQTPLMDQAARQMMLESTANTPVRDRANDLSVRLDDASAVGGRRVGISDVLGMFKEIERRAPTARWGCQAKPASVKAVAVLAASAEPVRAVVRQESRESRPEDTPSERKQPAAARDRVPCKWCGKTNHRDDNCYKKYGYPGQQPPNNGNNGGGSASGSSGSTSMPSLSSSPLSTDGGSNRGSRVKTSSSADQSRRSVRRSPSD